MRADRYRRFADELTAWARRHPDVVGLVALGSFADANRSPDEWSDHDFWVVAREGAADELRDDLSWLPDADRVVLSYEETAHGRNVIYDDGHLIEMAVFTADELSITRANEYRVLFDEAGSLEDRLRDIARVTDREVAERSAEAAWGRFLGQLVIGVLRAGRGERTSARWMMHAWATTNLLSLVRDHGRPAPGSQPDTLDPHRRVEQSFPGVAADLEDAHGSPPTALAEALLSIAERELAEESFFDPDAIAAVRSLIARAERASSE